jgi:hypothetical protein
LDSEAGLLPATAPRDCGFALHAGAFAMDQDALRARLHHAELVLGDVSCRTLPSTTPAKPLNWLPAQ